MAGRAAAALDVSEKDICYSTCCSRATITTRTTAATIKPTNKQTNTNKQTKIQTNKKQQH